MQKPEEIKVPDGAILVRSMPEALRMGWEIKALGESPSAPWRTTLPFSLIGMGFARPPSNRKNADRLCEIIMQGSVFPTSKERLTDVLERALDSGVIKVGE